MAGQASVYCEVEARGPGIPLLAAASKINADPQGPSAARESQGGP
jgi:hypothetical protein